MVSKIITINNPTGIHARPACELVAFAKKFRSEIILKYGAKEANCSSIISILALGAGIGAQINLIVSGDDEKIALKDVAEFIQNLKE